MKSNLSSIGITTLLVAFSPSIYALNTQIIQATPANTRILDNNYYGYPGPRGFNSYILGVTNGTIFGGIYERHNQDGNPYDSAIFNPSTFAPTAIPGRPTYNVYGNTGNVSVVGVDGGRMVAESPANENYYYTPESGWVSLERPSWIPADAPTSSFNVSGISGTHIVGTAGYGDETGSTLDMTVFIYDISSGNYEYFSSPDLRYIRAAGIDGTTIVGNYWNGVDNGIFTYDFESKTFPDHAIESERPIYAFGIYNGLIVGTMEGYTEAHDNKSGVFYDIASDTLSILDFSESIDHPFFLDEMRQRQTHYPATITGITDEMIVGYFLNSETRVAFVIDIVPEPSGVMLFGLSGALTLLRRKRSA